MMFGVFGLVHMLVSMSWFVTMLCDGFYTGGVVWMVVWFLTSFVWFFLQSCANEVEGE